MEHKQASCLGKHPYVSASLARKVAARVRVGKAVSYRCCHCGCWHIGTAIRKAKAARDIAKRSLVV